MLPRSDGPPLKLHAPWNSTSLTSTPPVGRPLNVFLPLLAAPGPGFEPGPGGAVKCKKGYYKRSAGNFKCSKCPAGAIQPGTGHTKCTQCALDRYANDARTFCSASFLHLPWWHHCQVQPPVIRALSSTALGFWLVAGGQLVCVRQGCAPPLVPGKPFCPIAARHVTSPGCVPGRLALGTRESKLG